MKDPNIQPHELKAELRKAGGQGEIIVDNYGEEIDEPAKEGVTDDFGNIVVPERTFD